MNCQRKGCLSQATGAVSINVPAVDHPVDGPFTASILLGLCLCDRCLAETTAADFFAAEPRMSTMLGGIVKHTSKDSAVPDFDRAFVRKVEFDNPAYIRLKAKNG